MPTRSTLMSGDSARKLTRMGARRLARTFGTAPNRTLQRRGPRLLSCEADHSVRARHHALDKGEQELPGGRALHVPAIPLEELDPELFLQPGDLAAESGLSGVGRACSPAETACLRDGQEGSEKIEFHSMGSTLSRVGSLTYIPRYFRMLRPAMRPELNAKAEARPEELLMG